MRLNRRDFLTLLGSSAGAFTAPASSVLGQTVAPRRKPTMVVFTDITPDIPLPRFAAMLGTMLAQGLPVTCILRLKSKDGRRLTPDSELAVLLRGFMRRAPGVLELMPHVEALANGTEFEQARIAYRARKDLVEALLDTDTSELNGPQFQSIACDFEPEPRSPQGVRSAGIRNILVLPDGSNSVKSEYWDNGVLRLTGGARADLFSALDHLGGLSPDQFQNIILLSVRETMDKSEHVVKAAAKVFSNVALQHEADQWISNLRLADLQLRDGYFRYERRIGLHLIEPGPGQTELAQGFDLFTEMLRRDSIRFSVGPRAIYQPGQIGDTGYWVATENSETSQSDTRNALINLSCSGGGPRPFARGNGYLDAGVGLILNPRSGGIQGIDACGNLQIPTVELTKLARTRNGPMAGTRSLNDLVLAVSPDLTKTPAQRNILRGEIGKLTDDWVTKVVPIGDLARPIVPKSPLISLYRQTQAYQPRIAPDRRPLTNEARELLFEDAVTAWTYFHRFTNKSTGLCPATMFYAGGSRSALNSATMWDISSHINALMAALEIGLIQDREFKRGIAKILGNIRGREKNGRRLPNEWIRTNRNNRGNTNFDGSDAGRLMACLTNLRAHRLADPDLQDLVDGWTFDQVIENGVLMSVIEDELQSTYVSHSAHYSALAFRKWGFDIKSPYEVTSQTRSPDDRMALLEAAAVIGPIGAEPLLLEALDFKMSPQSDYLADMLFGAQLREFDITGDLICVSESPIDQAPWFTYQGLQMNAPEDRTWVIDTVLDDPKYLTDSFQRDFRVTSTKAAYLWAAARPHEFSYALIDYVRKHGRTPIGFASAIYSRNDTPTRNYTDINTNGIILQSIAKILKDDENAG